MSRGSIDQPLAKLGRAAYHYRVVKFDVFGGHDRQAWPVTLERHRDGLEYRLRAPKIEPLPTDLPLIFGDAYFNLRAALDYLVFQLHLRHYRGNLPAKIVKSSAFPIYNQQPLAKGGALLDTCNWKEIGTLGKHERTALEWLQPYKGRGSGLTKQIREALSDLSSLNNIDKHQELHVTQRIVQAVPIPDFPPEFGFQQHPRVWNSPGIWRICRYMDIREGAAARISEHELQCPHRGADRANNWQARGTLSSGRLYSGCRGGR
jgi:hypothetical protein